MKKIFISLSIDNITTRLLQSAGYQIEIWQENEGISQDQLRARLKNCHGMISTGSEVLDQAFLESCKHLEVISLYSAGYNNVDIAHATKLGIPVYNSPGTMSAATADIAFLLLLAAARCVPYFQKLLSQNKWSKLSDTNHLGIELHNKTLGILGLGKIGLEMAKRCKGAYDMDIIYCNRSRNINAEKELAAKFVDFESLLSDSDIISVHCPLSMQTRHMFDRSAFEKMKKSAIFINTARGAVHHEPDLIQALKSNLIFGAGLDVTDPEPIDPLSDLLKMDNAIILPHIGSATKEARTAMAGNAAENIIRFYDSKSTLNLINDGALNN